MENRKDKGILKCLHVGFGILLLTSHFLLLTSITACGRRGDPVAISPYDEKNIKEDSDQKSPEKETDSTAIPAQKKQAEETEAVEVAQPDAPAGLRAVYTQTSIVLTWDDIDGQNVQSYSIYRSSGNGYELVGSAVTPAFTDREIKPDMEYSYKVTAVGKSESLPSVEIKVVTEIH